MKMRKLIKFDIIVGKVCSIKCEVLYILTETFSMNIEIRFFFSSGIRTNSFIEFSIEIILSDFGIFIHSLMNARSILKV